nr:MAG TPA: hypothetical protein [Caudoviricetes sp.]
MSVRFLHWRGTDPLFTTPSRFASDVFRMSVH